MKVNITLELKDKEQAHHLENYLRNNMFPDKVVSFINLPNTDSLKDDPIYKKLYKNVKDAKNRLYEYITKMN